MEQIVFLDRQTVRAKFRPLTVPNEWREYGATTPPEIVPRLKDATVAITNKVPLRAETLKQLPKLRLIAVAATGYDCVDVNICRERGITVCNVPDYTRHSVPDHVFMLILALRRNLPVYLEAVRTGRWTKSGSFSLHDAPLHDLRGATLGIVGYGKLGQAVEAIAKAFGMKVLIAERKGAAKARPGRAPFAEVLRASDVVTLHVSLVPDTQHLIGAPELALLKPSALLINTSRGAVIDETALASALTQNRLAGAGLDVLSQEPPPAGHPLLKLRLPNLIVTPHNAWASDEAMQLLADQIVANIEAFVQGRPTHQV